MYVPSTPQQIMQMWIHDVAIKKGAAWMARSQMYNLADEARDMPLWLIPAETEVVIPDNCNWSERHATI